MKKESSMQKLFAHAGNYKYLTIASWILSAVSALIALLPFYDIWRIMQEVVLAAPDYSKAQNLILTSVILIIGVSGAKVHIGAAELKGMALATIVGVGLSLIFKLISVIRPEEVVLDADDSEKAPH